MTTINTYKETKTYLKALAQEIKTLKSQRKQHNNGLVPGLSQKQREYRYKHIAMSLFRGKTIEQIEPTCRNDYDTKLAHKLANDFFATLIYDREVENEEALCDCA